MKNVHGDKIIFEDRVRIIKGLSKLATSCSIYTTNNKPLFLEK